LVNYFKSYSSLGDDRYFFVSRRTRGDHGAGVNSGRSLHFGLEPELIF